MAAPVKAETPTNYSVGMPKNDRRATTPAAKMTILAVGLKAFSTCWSNPNLLAYLAIALRVILSATNILIRTIAPIAMSRRFSDVKRS
ncbi:MAG: hypothetical protein PVF15_08840 [Candidatus Bathyarchaeota archaeon]